MLRKCVSFKGVNMEFLHPRVAVVISSCLGGTLTEEEAKKQAQILGYSKRLADKAQYQHHLPLWSMLRDYYILLHDNVAWTAI